MANDNNNDNINKLARDTADVIKNGTEQQVSEKLGEAFRSLQNPEEASKFSKALDEMNAKDRAASRTYLPDVQLFEGRSWSEYAQGKDSKPGVTVKYPGPLGVMYNGLQVIDPVKNGDTTAKNLDQARKG